MVSPVQTARVVTVEHSEGQNLCFGKKNVFSSQTMNMLYNVILESYAAIAKNIHEKANN